MNEPKPRARRATTSDRVKQWAPAYRIVEKCGGLMAFCDITGFPTATVHNWLRSGLIPAKWKEPGLSYQRHIITCASEHGFAIEPWEFVEGAAQ